MTLVVVTIFNFNNSSLENHMFQTQSGIKRILRTYRASCPAGKAMGLYKAIKKT